MLGVFSLLSRPLLAAMSLLALVAAPLEVRAQSAYGTDQRYCDRSALSRILSTSQGNLIGSAAGGALGGYLGNQIGKGTGNALATLAGVVGGALAGGYIGRSMDPTDQACVGQTLEHTPTSETVAWQNPGNGSSYWVTPTQSFSGPNGEACRNYITQAVVDGAPRRTENTACRQPDGRWVPVTFRQPPARRAPRETRALESSVSADTILQVQQRLHDLGFYVRDNIDGQWGPHTMAAVQNFQRSKGISPTGQLDVQTLSALGLSANPAAPGAPAQQAVAPQGAPAAQPGQ
jgi:surface antigen